jgi:hypothetical protein
MTIDQKIDEIENRLKTEAKIMAKHDYHETFHLACTEYVKLKGLWMEFGVFTGRSIEQFSRKAPDVIYGFDCFDGLPEYWDENNPKGCYGLGGQIPPGYIVGENHSMFNTSLPTNWKPWPENVKLVKGYFEDTLPVFLKKFEGDVAFVHIDGDLYSSAKTVFDNLKPRFKKGSVILFDEIVDYAAYREHEIKAFAEFLLDTGFDYTPHLYQNLGYSQGLFELK